MKLEIKYLKLQEPNTKDQALVTHTFLCARILAFMLTFNFMNFITFNSYAQWIGGSQDGYAMVKNADCAAYPPYPNMFLGGSQDGYAMVKNTDCAAYPPYPNMFLGGSQDGYAMVKNTDCAAYPPYPNIYIGGTCSGESGIARTCSTLWVVPSCRLPFPPLPIELLSFSAKWLDKQYTTVILQWATAAEINNDYFVVERSIDAIDFMPIVQIDGAGNSKTTITYYAFDKEPFKTVVSYYRLKQVDFDGKYTHSHIEVILPIDGIDLISIAPNPAPTQFEYTVSSSETTKVIITATDVLGRKIIEQTLLINKGINKLNLDITKLSAAVYILQITTESGLYKTHKQFVKGEK